MSTPDAPIGGHNGPLIPARALRWIAVRGYALLASLLSLGGCEDSDAITSRRFPLEAICTVNVQGRGIKEVETDYLPHVVACENGSADGEALKAQAVAARSYMSYRIELSGSVQDGTGDQVYTCSTQPSAAHYQAVQQTAGQVLVYSNVVICSFFVAGATPSTASCIPVASDPDSSPPTEYAVTYNEGKTGSAVAQSALGSIDPANVHNRGCMSQNGSHCLSQQGRPYAEILRFYYGADIQLTTTNGSCVTPLPDGSIPQHDGPRPTGDQRPPVYDQQGPWAEGVVPPLPDGGQSQAGSPPLYGSCQLTPAGPPLPQAAWWGMIFLLLGGWGGIRLTRLETSLRARARRRGARSSAAPPGHILSATAPQKRRHRTSA